MYVGFRTNQSSIPLGSLLYLLVLDQQGPLLCFVESSEMKIFIKI